MLRPLTILLILALLVAICSCDRRNPILPEEQEAQKIEFLEDIIPLESGDFIYRQGLQLTQESDELSFAYRLSTLKAGDIPGFSTDNEGWLIFPNQSIWTSQSHLSLDWLSDQGKIGDMITMVEVKYRHLDGQIESDSFPFRSSRVIGTQLSAQFAPGDEVSTGLEFNLRESFSDIYVDGMYAHHFMYRLSIVDLNMNVLQPGNWFSTINCPDIRRLILNGNTVPALTPNPPDTYSQLEVYVVSRSGVVQDAPVSTYFKVVGGFQPVAILYHHTLVGLGRYHYSVKPNGTMPYVDYLMPNAQGFNTNLYPTATGYSAVNSEDFKLHLRWGFKGEYGTTMNNGVVITNNPFDQQVNQVLSPDDTNYHSRITAFWLRLDGAPFPVLPNFLVSQQVQHSDGSNWLRVVNFNDNCRQGNLSNLTSGIHTLELMVEDLQGVLSAPLMKTIELHPYIPASQRSGILIVDNSPNNSNYSPETVVDTFYNNVVPTNYGLVEVLDMATEDHPEFSFIPSRLQNYKAVLLHSDNPMEDLNAYYLLNGMDFYLENQGVLILSGTNKFKSALQVLDPGWCAEKFGISQQSGVYALSSSLISNPYFVRAEGIGSNQDIPLNLNTGFNSLVMLRQGLSAITYFDDSLGLDWLFGFGCKPVDSPTYPPTEAEYNLLSTKYVAYRYQNAGSNLVVFGFPLSFMEQDSVAQNLNIILSNIFSGSVAQRRRP